ncbi:MAG TPA: GAF domain-containing protein [Chroococcales cyanobacterium]
MAGNNAIASATKAIVSLSQTAYPDSPKALMPDQDLQRITNRLVNTLRRDILVQTTVNNLRTVLNIDRVVLYYFYREWEGRVTFESLSSSNFSIFGATGPDECFNSEYAALYLAGRVRAIPDIEVEPINPCHRDFLRGMQVRANLAVPVLINSQRLWGLLVAHHCQDVHAWSTADIESMQKAAKELSISPSIQDS